jgi:geranylgeranyl pyrophosphate synthase
MVILAREKDPEKWDHMIDSSDSSNILKNTKKFFKENGIIDATVNKAKSYFKSARKNLNQINSIEAEELLKFTKLIEKRTF